MRRRVVITGLGLVSPLSSKVNECWTRMLNGESGIHRIKLVDVSDIRINFGGDVQDFDCSNYIDKKEEKRIDRFSQFALVAGIDAVVDSGLDFTQMNPYRAGVVLGSGIGGLQTIEEQMAKLIQEGPHRVSPLTVPRMMLNAAGASLSIKYGLKGPNFSTATACASATNAMGDALRLIQYGACDVILTGGTEAAMTRMGLSAFQNMKALSGRVDDPQRASRPFDKDRDGFVLSEGAGILVFEEMEFAKARGARIYAEVVGFATTADGNHITQPDLEGSGAAEAMRQALVDADLAPEKIDYINAHGTSTPLGDKAETVAIKRVFGEHAYKLSINSTKSQLGHSLGASGGIELLVCCKSIENGIVPPTINLQTPDPECDLDYTPNVPKNRNIEYAMSNSFGFGGHDASIIIRKFVG
ncbi:MAG: beta-ketoacyl-ACP synthase II [Planctomycetaceae bacterium]|nr:beta-ketoacyl-ACP synthase II [Planctomycetaceae bacterium]